MPSHSAVTELARPMPELVYAGSVKNVYRDVQMDGAMAQAVNYFEFTDAYSVFDWGRMPDAIAGKGKALCLMGGLLFEAMGNPESWKALPKSQSLAAFDVQFCSTLFQGQTYQTIAQCGLRHHFLGWVDALFQPISTDALMDPQLAPRMKVRAVTVTQPRPFHLEQSTVYEYPLNASHQQEAATLIPLEVVFRFGMTPGSSLAGRLEKNSHYAAQLGLDGQPEMNTLFRRPVVEFFTKLEPTDRYLSPQEAFLISGLSSAQFQALHETVMLLSLWLYDFFAQRDITLWDGKFEFALSDNGVMLVDSIGPDELRLTYDGIQLSKEVLRQFYRNTAWEQATREAKTLAATQPGADWTHVCETTLNQTPPPFTANQKEIAESLYGALTNHCFEQNYLATTLNFEQLIDKLKPLQSQQVSA